MNKDNKRLMEIEKISGIRIDGKPGYKALRKIDIPNRKYEDSLSTERVYRIVSKVENRLSQLIKRGLLPKYYLNREDILIRLDKAYKMGMHNDNDIVQFIMGKLEYLHDGSIIINDDKIYCIENRKLRRITLERFMGLYKKYLWCEGIGRVSSINIHMHRIELDKLYWVGNKIRKIIRQSIFGNYTVLIEPNNVFEQVYYIGCKSKIASGMSVNKLWKSMEAIDGTW